MGATVRTAAELARVRTLERRVPVPERLNPLFPDGLACGGFIALAGGAAISLAAAMVSEATRRGSWLAMVDLEHVAHGALAEAGVALERTVSVRTGSQMADVLGALVGGFDLVIVGASLRCTAAEARRLAARTRAESCVVLLLGHDPSPELRLDARVRCGPSRWDFDAGARRRWVTVTVTGRDPAAAPRRAELCLPPG
jgi:hypothetical protein